MTVERNEIDLRLISFGGTASVYEIDNDRLTGPLGDGEWESVFSERLIEVAAAHGDHQLTCHFHGEVSANFGGLGFSVWIALCGNQELKEAAGHLLQDIIPARSIRKTVSDLDFYWLPRIHITDGKVWRPYDEGVWIALSDEGEQLNDPEDDASTSAATPSDPPEAETTVQRKKRKSALNAARDGVRVGYYQQKIERLLSLPEGSVKFVNPDGSISHPSQLIGSLRSRWED